ncbi:MAG: peptidoglycan editing factor PgeF [Clostridia bacterium]|nr:peptidoglycan editing factor PgeF [Clostridia bacterium]
MFYTDGILVRSTLLENANICHAFSTRLGGVSTHSHTREMNIAPGHGDDFETVYKNTDILVREASNGVFTAENAVVTSQIHSAKVRLLTTDNCGEGVARAAGDSCDGFVTDSRGIVPIVRTADCVPILFTASKADGSPVVAAVHAGWRGTVSGIAAEAVKSIISLGAAADSVKVAIGPHIGKCCFQVQRDFYDSVAEIRGEEFARRYITDKGGLFADLTSMNVGILIEAGVLPHNIDVSDECTCCNPEKYHSHRKTHGLRGAMGSLIAIL